MSGGTYECVVHCPSCNGEVPVRVEWWYTPGGYYEPPDGEANLMNPDGSELATNCPHCGIDWNIENEKHQSSYEQMWAEAEKLQPPEPDVPDLEDALMEAYDEYEAETRHQGPDQ